MPNPNPLEAVAIGVGAGLLYWWFNSGSNWQTVVINNYKQCEEAVKILRKHCEKNSVLSFECEWVSESQGVARLKLCSHKGYCAVITLSAEKPNTSPLYDLLNDSHVVKVGVDIHLDAGRLLRKFNLPIVSTLDLRFVAVLTGAKSADINKQADDIPRTQMEYRTGTVDAIAGMKMYTTLAQRVSDVSIFQQYYDQEYDPHYHDGLKPITTNTCPLQ